MDAATHANFELVKQTIQHKWGSQAVQSLRAYSRGRTTAVIATGFDELDTLLGMGGIPCGHATLLFGAPTSGVTTLAYHIITSAQRLDAVVTYVDGSHTFDAEYAGDRCGVDTEHLLHIVAGQAGEALAIVRDLVDLAYRGLIILDVGITTVQQGIGLSSLRQLLERVRIPLRQSAWTLLVLLPQSFLKPCASLGAVHLLLERSC